MSTHGVRGALIGYRRRKAVPDLNAPPPESRGHEGTSSTQADIHEVQPTIIDVEVLDDDVDVVESSPRAFAEAKNNSRRKRAAFVVDFDSGRTSRVANIGRITRQTIPPNQPVINCELYINLESSANSKRENVPKPPPPIKELVFTCPICMGPLTEEMSTRCGHIFCKECIKAAIAAPPQGKCPTCRKKVTVKELIRVFLPSTN